MLQAYHWNTCKGIFLSFELHYAFTFAFFSILDFNTFES